MASPLPPLSDYVKLKQSLTLSQQGTSGNTNQTIVYYLDESDFAVLVAGFAPKYFCVASKFDIKKILEQPLTLSQQGTSGNTNQAKYFCVALSRKDWTKA